MATISFVQKGGVFAGSLTPSVTLSSAATVGNILVVPTLIRNDNAHVVSGISGGGVATWHKVISTNVYADTEIWWGEVTTSGSTTVTVTFSGRVVFTSFWVVEFHSTGSGNWAVDQSSTSSSASTSISSGTITTTIAESVVVGCGTDQTNFTSGPSNSFSRVNSGTGDALQVAYKILTSTGVQETSWTFSASGGADGAIANFYYGATAITKDLADNLTINETFNLSIGKIFNESVQLIETFNLAIKKFFTEAYLISETFQYIWILSKAEIISLTDTINRNISIGKSDVITLTENLQNKISIILREGINLMDSMNRKIGLFFSENTFFSDLVKFTRERWNYIRNYLNDPVEISAPTSPTEESSVDYEDTDYIKRYL